MKKYINIIIGLLLVISLSCRDEALDPRPNLSDNIGAITKITVISPSPNFNLLNDLNKEVVTFDLDVDGFGFTTVKEVKAYVTWTQKNGTLSVKGDPIDKIYDRKLINTYTTFPVKSISITGKNLADLYGISTAAEFKLGDTFSITFDIETADGRTLKVALNSNLCTQPAQPSFGGCELKILVTCPSDLAGEVDYEFLALTGGSTKALMVGDKGTMQIQGEAGTYTWDTFTFGVYQANFNCCELERDDMRMFVVCNKLSMTPKDSFGQAWSLTVVSVTDKVLVVDLEGASFGTARIQLTRKDDKVWGPLY